MDAPTNWPPFGSLDELLAWLDTLPVPAGVATARLLADRTTQGALAAYADHAVYEMTRRDTYPVVEGLLGTTRRAVERAVANHLARQRPAA
jgi:hypothetical protein